MGRTPFCPSLPSKSQTSVPVARSPQPPPHTATTDSPTYFVPRLRLQQRHRLPSPDTELKAALSLAPELLSPPLASPSSASLPPDRYDFTVGRVDLGGRGSALVRQVSASGFSVPLSGSVRRALGRKPRRRPPPPGQELEQAKLIAGLKAGGIISRTEERPPFFCDWFTVPKTSGALRFIFNGSAINDAAPPPPKFRHHGVRACKAKARHCSWAAKLDIRHCFYNIEIDPDMRKYFSIRLDDGFYSFNRLPMGFTWSSYVVSRMLRETLRPISDWVTVYADDIVVWASSEEECARYLAEAHALLAQAGWSVHPDKTVPPCQRLDILGVTFDLVSKTCCLSHSFRRSLASSLLEFSSHSHATKRSFAELFGAIAWGAVAVPSLFPLANPLLHAMLRARDWDSLVSVDSAVLSSLRSLGSVVARNPWATFRALAPGFVRFWSDASGRFLSVHTAGSAFCRRFLSEERPLHISSKEALALHRALAFALSAGRDALFLVDAKALFQALSKGRSSNPLFSACCSLFARGREAGLAWRVQWVPTHDNRSDLPTRPELLPTGVTHPELVVPGLPALLPAGWSSPVLCSFIRSGAATLGRPFRDPVSGLSLARLDWTCPDPQGWLGG